MLQSRGAVVLIVGVIGIGVIATSALAMMALNSQGLTKPVALLHLFELPFYLALLYWAAHVSSIEWLLGVWMLRLAFDAWVMSQMAIKNSAPPKALAPRLRLRDILPWLAVVTGLIAIAVLYLQPVDASLRKFFLISGAIVGLATGANFLFRLQYSFSHMPVRTP